MSVRTARGYQSAEDFEYLVVNIASMVPHLTERCIGCVYWGGE